MLTGILVNFHTQGCAISDAGCTHLAAFPCARTLTDLNVGHCGRVKDAGVCVCVCVCVPVCVLCLYMRAGAFLCGALCYYVDFVLSMRQHAASHWVLQCVCAREYIAVIQQHLLLNLCFGCYRHLRFSLFCGGFLGCGLSAAEGTWGTLDSRTRFPKKGCQNKGAKTRVPKQGCQNKGAKTRLPRKGCQNKGARTRLARKGCQNKGAKPSKRALSASRCNLMTIRCELAAQQHIK